MIKGHYVGMIEINFSFDENTPGFIPVEALRRATLGGVLTGDIVEVVSDMFPKGSVDVHVKQLDADLRQE